MSETKERILNESLSLFAERGYRDVTMTQIAAAVGIKAPSIYKHFPSKKAILDSIIDKAQKRYSDMASGIGIDGINPNPDSEIFSTMGVEDLIVMGKRLFSFYLHDEYESRIRRMLNISRLSDPEIDAMYTSQYYELPLAYQKVVFEKLCKAYDCDADPEVLAFQFYTPMFTLLQYCDFDPGKVGYAEQMIERHIREFNRIFTEG